MFWCWLGHEVFCGLLMFAFLYFGSEYSKKYKSEKILYISWGLTAIAGLVGCILFFKAILSIFG